MHKIYVATAVENHEKARTLAQRMKDIGWEITYDWYDKHLHLDREAEDMRRDVAYKEVGGVWHADAVIVLAKGRRGTHVELGVALGRNKPILLWAQSEDDLWEDGRSCSFYSHGNITKIICPFDELPTRIVAWARERKTVRLSPLINEHRVV